MTSNALVIALDLEGTLISNASTMFDAFCLILYTGDSV